MSIFAKGKPRQRADYTHKFNAKSGRYGWLRLTPAYSVKVVEELMGQCKYPLRILDPILWDGDNSTECSLPWTRRRDDGY